MPGKSVIVDKNRGPAGFCQIGDLLFRDPKVGRHPDSAQSESDPGALEQLNIIGRMDQYPVPLANALGTQCMRHRIDPGIDLFPRELLGAFYEARLVRKPATDIL